VRDRFFDADAGRRWAERHRDFGRGLASREVFAAEANRRLAELKASHTGLYTPDDWMHHALAAVFRLGGRHRHTGLEGIGADVALTPQGAFVRRVFAGSPSERAGLRRGDEIVSVDGGPFHPVLSFRGKAGRDAVLAVRRREGGPPEEIRASVRRVPLPREWLDAQKQGSRVIWHRGRRIGVIPLFVGAGQEYQAAAQEALQSPAFQQADALVLDLRDGLGGLNPGFVSLFDREVPVLTIAGREGPVRTHSATWRRRMVVLVNGGSRSGKEIVARALQRHGLAVLVGERTAGAVLGGSAFPLSDGSLLYLAVSDVRSDGERLEGRRVDPDVPVPGSLPYAGGRDPQMERALDVAAAG